MAHSPYTLKLFLPCHSVPSVSRTISLFLFNPFLLLLKRREYYPDKLISTMLIWPYLPPGAGNTVHWKVILMYITLSSTYCLFKIGPIRKQSSTLMCFLMLSSHHIRTIDHRSNLMFPFSLLLVVWVSHGLWSSQLFLNLFYLYP